MPAQAAPRQAAPAARTLQAQPRPLFDRHVVPHFQNEATFLQRYLSGMHAPGTTVTERGNELHVGGSLRDAQGRSIGNIQRRIIPEERRAYHAYLNINPSAQAHGVAKQLMRDQIDVYKQMGIDKVTLLANIDVGGYAWAKYGYAPSIGDWRAVANAAQQRLAGLQSLPPEIKQAVEQLLASRDPKAIWALADIRFPVGDSTLGKRLLLDQSWHGTLDLTDAASLARFDAYVRR
jgi:GNAT superfamily N-acetyltransferase